MKSRELRDKVWPSEDALCSLLDDDSELVRKSLIELFKTNPTQAKVFLQKLSMESSPLLVKNANALQNQLGWNDSREEFLKFISSQRFELETGWYLLDKTVFPEFDSSEASLVLDGLADRVRELLMSPVGEREYCTIINRVFFHEQGFRGARKNFENPDNSFIHKVLKSKQGLPITLSLIYILVARRVGLNLEPIGLPGRFMVGCFSEEIPFYIDVWAGGKFIELEDMSAYLGLSAEECSSSVLLPVTVAETLARGCRNLAHHYSLAGKSSKADMFKAFVEEFEKIRNTEKNAP